jgi:hypothetical protein
LRVLWTYDIVDVYATLLAVFLEMVGAIFNKERSLGPATKALDLSMLGSVDVDDVVSMIFLPKGALYDGKKTPR